MNDNNRDWVIAGLILLVLVMLARQNQPKSPPKPDTEEGEVIVY